MGSMRARLGVSGPPVIAGAESGEVSPQMRDGTQFSRIGVLKEQQEIFFAAEQRQQEIGRGEFRCT
jgi:hypothetical protein